MVSQKDITKRDYMIFKTNVIRNDLTGTDDFRFLKRYEPYGYNSQVSPINRVVRFDTEHPAFTFLEKATVTPISFCPENYRSKYSMSMGEFWDAYNYSEKPNFKELQEEYLSWYPINK